MVDMNRNTGHKRATRAELVAILESSHDAIVGMTAAGVISSCNSAAAGLYGYTVQELIGRPAEILVPLERRDAEAADLRRVIEGAEVAPFEADRLCRDGSLVTVSSTMSPIIDRAGAVVGAAVISHRTSTDRTAADRTAPDQVAADRTAADRTAADRIAADRTAAERAAAGRAQAQRDKDTLDAQQLQSQRLEILGQLAGGVAHDFNNLLGVILNYASFVGEELAAGPHCDWSAASSDVAQIQRAAERATALTHQLLAFARREVVQPRVLDLNHVVTEVQQLLERTIGDDVMLCTDLAEDLWPVLADAGRLEQVLVNLAVNARDAMSGGGTLSIDTANITVDADFIAVGSTVPPGRHVRLRVGDTGTGMTPDVLAHVFDPFFTTKPDGVGTGLGLATVYGIVVQSGATVDIHSQPGIGTTFTIMIPVTDEVAVPVVAPQSYLRTPTGEMVLVVEDEKTLREVTERIFTRAGYRVLTAANGAEAIALAASYDGEIHLLVTDVVMPNMLGKEVAEQIRQLRSEIEVLYMSGYARPVLASGGRLNPNVSLIEKPFTAAELIDRAGQILNGHFSGFHTVEGARAPTPTPPTPTPTPMPTPTPPPPTTTAEQQR